MGAIKLTEACREDAARLYEFLSEHPAAEPSDLLLVLGCHDLRVAEHAAKLWLAGTAPLMICSGGYGKMTEGVFSLPEGELFARRCRELGVPDETILVEDRAANTGENFSRSRALVSGLSSGVAVCKPYMAKRALAAGKRQWPELRWSVSVPPLPFSAYAPDDEALIPEIELMVGDFQRLKLYAERGFQAPTPIPDALWAPWRRLAEAGFDRYVIRE